MSLHALLIGINGYTAVPPLSGCVNDALAVGDYFKRLCAQQEPPIVWNPTYLLAPADAQEEAMLQARGITYKAPTRANIIAAFEEAFGPADPARGDFALFYYSGHGSQWRAPEIFRDCEPTGQMQSLVCVDSRVGGERDLLDKELGYLIAKVLDGKAAVKDGPKKRPGVHFLAITDSCHSGTNTRDLDYLKARMAPPSKNTVDAADILGFTRTGNCFYEPFGPEQTRVKPYGGLKHARYIKLSSAQNAEKSFEMPVPMPQGPNQAPLYAHHGVFTYSLLNALAQSGANLSYRELMRRAQLEVVSRVNGQVPMLDNSDTADDDLLFLRNQCRPPKQTYEVFYRKEEWLMDAGAIQGIIPNAANAPTTVRLLDGTERIVPVQMVRVSESVLDAGAFTEADQGRVVLQATLDQMSFPSLAIGFGHELLESPDAALRTKLENAWANHTPRYLRWATGGQPYALEIRVEPTTGAFTLYRPGAKVPLFGPTPNPTVFLRDAEKVARCENVLNLNPSSPLRERFQVEVQVMEGVKFGRATLETLFNADTLAPENYRCLIDPDVVPLRYVEAGGQRLQPALKAKITLKGIPDAAYWVGALYCDHQFGIRSDLVPVQRLGLKGAPSANVEFSTPTQKWSALPVMADHVWREWGADTVCDHLLFFISTATDPFRLDGYNQTPIELGSTRALGFGLESEDLERDEWFVIKIPLVLSL